MNTSTGPKQETANRSPSNSNDELARSIEVPTVRLGDPNYRARRFAQTGLFLGLLAGCASLMSNVIGSVAWPAITGEPQHTLRLIQVYLTFPFGETALRLDGGLTMAAGCVLYLCTGMLYGTIFELVLSLCVPRAGLRARLTVCSFLSLAVWVINFSVLAWLQPALLGGRWIVDLVPWWVAAATHLVFGWTIAALYPLGIPKSLGLESVEPVNRVRTR